MMLSGGSDDEEVEDGKKNMNLKEDLVSFREQWHKEVNESKNKNLASTSKANQASTIITEDTKNNELSEDEKAAKLFVQGVKHEREGNFNAAVYFYRQAVKIVPDIESKIAENQVANYVLSEDDESYNSEEDQDEVMSTNSAELDSLSKSYASMRVTGLCEQMNPPEKKITHISELPTELLMVIIKWIVSTDLDIKSLENLALVCKWFYSCSRDTELWKLICIRVWGIHCTSVDLYNGCWRRMFINKPRVKYNGVYISTNSYVRIGEQTVDSFYKPYHFVEYYKYLRFFPDGSVLIYTFAGEPQNAIQMLQRPPYSDPTVYKGYYRLTNEHVLNIFFKRISRQIDDGVRRQRGRRNIVENKEQHFFMQLLLKESNTKKIKKKNNQLIWSGYTYQCINRKTGHTSESDIDISTFRPYYFSAVRSYQTQSNAPL